MERRSHKSFNSQPRPQIFLKRPQLLRFKGKSVEEVKAQLRVIAELQKVAGNG